MREIAIGFVAALVLAGCGGDDEKAPSDPVVEYFVECMQDPDTSSGADPYEPTVEPGSDELGDLAALKVGDTTIHVFATPEEAEAAEPVLIEQVGDADPVDAVWGEGGAIVSVKGTDAGVKFTADQCAASRHAPDG